MTTANVQSATAPEPGQLVEVRRRQWMVADVDGSSVSPELPKRHLVKLSSIDEDALGEEIEVLWELEPGAHVIERAGLPSLAVSSIAGITTDQIAALSSTQANAFTTSQIGLMSSDQLTALIIASNA